MMHNVEEFREAMRTHRQNLASLQDWMRKEGVERVNIELDPITRMSSVNFKSPNEIDVHQPVLRQTVHDADYSSSKQMDITPLMAAHEIVRFTISTDDIVRNTTFSPDGGGLLVIPHEGALELVRTNLDFEIRKNRIN